MNKTTNSGAASICKLKHKQLRLQSTQSMVVCHTGSDTGGVHDVSKETSADNPASKTARAAGTDIALPLAPHSVSALNKGPLRLETPVAGKIPAVAVMKKQPKLASLPISTKNSNRNIKTVPHPLKTNAVFSSSASRSNLLGTTSALPRSHVSSTFDKEN